MDKLEHYLDQVCHGIAGPRDLRRHLRQELREHLLDAAAEHRRAGLPEEEALAKALDDFGGPAEVRAELEAAHGHRLMAVILDKALQWKEKTMKAKWLWTTWVHVALIKILAVEVIFIYAAMIFIVPKFHQLANDGALHALGPTANGFEAWCFSFLMMVAGICNNGWWIALAVALLWGLFEWRVRSDNKTSIRLAAISTIALLLLLVVALTAMTLSIPAYMEIPSMHSHAATASQPAATAPR